LLLGILDLSRLLLLNSAFDRDLPCLAHILVNVAVFTFVALNLCFFVLSLTFGSGLNYRFLLFDVSLDLPQCVSEDIIIA
jgi:hypothetical protein